METFIAIVAIVLGLLGIVGSIVPAMPGPPLSWLGLLCLYIWGSGANAAGEPLSTTVLFTWLAIVAAVSILDFVVPAYFTKLTGGSKYGGWGAFIGLVVGLFAPPIGMVIGSLLGAFLAEAAFANKDAATSVKAALGAFIGFLFGTGAKLICSGVMLYYIIIYAF